ncbi:hypothetical protein EV675_2717 [Pigmentiphaga kullae]|uniref:ChsH2 C-terminal OB-fold domain-containing protein n=2 Tax=Pigmentiphaga kullae TaxID=151784 RepID=A0A4Q7NN79_9BURK|nr:hypothetical protein EV675_2717 [Pigmentiphaga kullae]
MRKIRSSFRPESGVTLDNGQQTQGRFFGRYALVAMNGASLPTAARLDESPYATFVRHCKDGELPYQVCTVTGKPVFYPRVAGPETGSDLEWRISGGRGTVYASTVVFRDGQASHNVALIDLDEGFRMMSRVDGVPPLAVQIGMRVKVRMLQIDGHAAPLPVFFPLEEVR